MEYCACFEVVPVAVWERFFPAFGVNDEKRQSRKSHLDHVERAGRSLTQDSRGAETRHCNVRIVDAARAPRNAAAPQFALRDSRRPRRSTARAWPDASMEVATRASSTSANSSAATRTPRAP